MPEDTPKKFFMLTTKSCTWGVVTNWIQSINRKDLNANQAQILLFVVLLTTVTPGLRYKAN